jgi:type II secretion system protein N
MALKFDLDPRTNAKVRTALKWIGYPSLYFVLLLLFAYWSFPYERLEQRIVAGYAASQQGKPDQKRLVIGDITWSWRFPGVVLSDVELVGPKPPTPAEGDKTAKQSTIYVEEVYAGVSLLNALFGDVDVDFDVIGFNGELSGSFQQSEAGIQLDVELDGVDPGQLPGVAEALQLPLTGSATGSIVLSIPEGKYANAEGQVQLEIEELAVGDGTTKVRDLVALPTVQVGTLELVASVTKGRVKLEKLAAKGGDLDVSADGRLRLRDPFATSMIESVDLEFKFSDKYRDKDDTTRSLLGKPGDKVGGVIDMDPTVKRAKGEDGFYRWRLTGLLAKPSFRPGGASAPSAGKKDKESKGDSDD